MNTHVPGQRNNRQLASRALIVNTHVPGQHNHRQLASRALIMYTQKLSSTGLARTHNEHTRSWST